MADIVSIEAAKTQRDMDRSEHVVSLDIYRMPSGEIWARQDGDVPFADLLDLLRHLEWVTMGLDTSMNGAPAPVAAIWITDDGNAKIRWNDDLVTHKSQADWIADTSRIAAESLRDDLSD